jgi:hypothetical protein
MAHSFEINTLEAVGLVIAGACVLVIYAQLVDLVLDWIYRRALYRRFHGR